MSKKCLICSKPAEYVIKNSTDFYCKACAKDFFADLNLLCKVESQAQKLKVFLNEKVTLDDDGQVMLKEDE